MSGELKILNEQLHKMESLNEKITQLSQLEKVLLEGLSQEDKEYLIELKLIDRRNTSNIMYLLFSVPLLSRIGGVALGSAIGAVAGFGAAGPIGGLAGMLVGSAMATTSSTVLAVNSYFDTTNPHNAKRSKQKEIVDLAKKFKNNKDKTSFFNLEHAKLELEIIEMFIDFQNQILQKTYRSKKFRKSSETMTFSAVPKGNIGIVSRLIRDIGAFLTGGFSKVATTRASDGISNQIDDLKEKIDYIHSQTKTKKADKDAAELQIFVLELNIKLLEKYNKGLNDIEKQCESKF